MPNITKFFKGVQKADVQATVEKKKRFVRTKKEERQLEEDNLPPDPIPDYVGPDPNIDPVLALSLKLVFPSTERLDQFKKYFRVAAYIEPSVTDLGPLFALLDALDSDVVFYDKESETLSTGAEQRITPSPFGPLLAYLQPLLAFIKELEAGNIIYDQNTGEIKFITEED
jgi:hypothetical protein